VQTIKAAVCRTFGQPLVIEDIQLRAPEIGEVEVTLEACAVCHSDISYMDGGWGGDLPAVYGHEAAGKITGLGPDVQGYALGDDVVVTLIHSCGHCPACATADPAYCDNSSRPSALTTSDGGAISRPMNCGAFAEKVTVHSSQLAKIPANMPKTSACLLACGVLTGVGSVVNAARVKPGEVVTVIGAGGVGLNAIQGAAISGAAHIIAVDMSEEKLEMAKEFGATAGVLATSDKPWKAAVDAAGGQLADVVVVSVGSIPAYNSAPRFLGRKGRLIMAGMNHSGEVASYDPSVIASLGQHMIGTKMGDPLLTRDIPWLVELYGQGRLKLDEMVSGTYRLDQINEAIADTKTGKAKRNVIVF
jgi:Zn-dependent alcohol dehydrogenase